MRPRRNAAAFRRSSTFCESALPCFARSGRNCKSLARATCQSCALSMSRTLKIAHWTLRMDRPCRRRYHDRSQLLHLRHGLTSQVPQSVGHAHACRWIITLASPASLGLIEASNSRTFSRHCGRPHWADVKGHSTRVSVSPGRSLAALP